MRTSARAAVSTAIRHSEVLVSAQTGEGIDALLAAIDKALYSDPVIEAEFAFRRTMARRWPPSKPAW